MIGIAMTTYNGERFLREQIDSILNQTYTDFELIVCDDCSTDSTVDILNEYAQKDSRVHIFQNEENLGFIKNFEKAIGICLERDTEYIALSDQDDIWRPNHLDILLNVLKNNKGVACGDALLFNGKKNTLNTFTQTFYKDIDIGSLSNTERLKYFLYGRSVYQGASMLLHRSICNIVFPIPPSLPIHDTWIVFLSVCLNRFYFTNEIVTQYRIHQNNTSNILLPQKNTNFIVSKIYYYFHRGRKYHIRFYYLNEIMHTSLFSEISSIYQNEIKKAFSYYKYKKFFFWRIFHSLFFFKRLKYFIEPDKQPMYLILRYLFWG